MMTEDPRMLARDAELARARLDLAIDRLEDRLTLAGLADEAVGAIRRADGLAILERGARALARHPLPVMLIAAGAGLLAWRLAERRRPTDGEQGDMGPPAGDDWPAPDLHNDTPEMPTNPAMQGGDTL